MSISKSLYQSYQEEVKIFKGRMRAVAGYSLLASMCMLAVPAFLFQIYDRVLLSRNVETLIALSLIGVVVLISYGIFDTVRQTLLVRAATELDMKLSGPCLAAELARQSDPSPQSLRDLATLRQTIASPIFSNLFDLPMMPMFTIIIFLVHPVLGMVLLTGAACLVGIAIWGDRATAPANLELMGKGQEASRMMEAQVQHQEMVRAQGSYREAVTNWGRHNAEYLERFNAGHTKTSAFAATSKAFRQFLQISMIAIGAGLVLADQASVGVIFAASIIGSRALAPLEAIVGGWRNINQGWLTKKRLEERLKELSLPTDRTPLPAPKGALSVEKAAYVPKPGAPALLRNIHVAFKPGDSVAVIGPSGAGKSTLARMLVGYYEPSVGRVSLDGQDLRAWDPTARGLYMGYMPQNVNFFEATIRENIARMRIDDHPDYAIRAAQRAGVHDLIVRFPLGYDTPLSRTGFWPSGGQSQLIALARAFYGDPRVLVLDEPNAALDTAGEQIFHRAIANARKAGLTTIIVTQRPSILPFVENVLIMQDGQVKDYGPKEKVMQANQVRQVPGQSQKGQNQPGQNQKGQNHQDKNASGQEQKAAPPQVNNDVPGGTPQAPAKNQNDGQSPSAGQ